MKNFYACLKLGKDKRMIAILSTMISYFNCQFVIQNDAIGIAGTELMIQDEQSAKAFESHMMDVYHFFRNVINTKNKRINRKKSVAPENVRYYTKTVCFSV